MQGRGRFLTARWRYVYRKRNASQGICGKSQTQAGYPMHFKPSDGALDIEGVESFLRLFDEKDIVRIRQGLVELSAEKLNDGFGVIYLERVK